MTIRQLKEHIKDFPDETELLVYLRNSEDAGWLNQIEFKRVAPTYPYSATVYYRFCERNT